MDDVVLLGAFELAFGNWQMRLEQDYGSSRVSRASAKKKEKRKRKGERRPFVFLFGGVVGGNGWVLLNIGCCFTGGGIVGGGGDRFWGRSTKEIVSSEVHGQRASLLWRMFGRVETKAGRSIEMYVSCNKQTRPRP